MTRTGHFWWVCIAASLPSIGSAGSLPIADATPWSWLAGLPFAPLLFLLAHILMQQIFFSSTAFCIAAGLLFGPFYGLLLGLTGAVAGGALSFLTSRHLLAPWVTSRLSPRLQRIREEVEQEGWRAVALIRLLPLLPYAPVNYTLGLTRLSLLQFLLPTTLCIAPRVAIYAYLGYAGRQALVGTLGVIWNALIALGVLVAISWLPHLLFKRRYR